MPSHLQISYTSPVTEKNVTGFDSPEERGQEPQHRTGMRLFCSCPSFGGSDGRAQALLVSLRVPQSVNPSELPPPFDSGETVLQLERLGVRT